MVGISAEESALLIACPSGERAVGRLRARLDPAAGVGVPPHVTLIYPFKQRDLLTVEEHDRLRLLFASSPRFAMTCATTGWFGDDFLYVQPQDPVPIQALIAGIAVAFPDFPPYAGSIDDVVPHVTVGTGHPQDVLRSAEREVRTQLPFVQEVNTVELWAGPALASLLGTWQRVQSYQLS